MSNHVIDVQEKVASEASLYLLAIGEMRQIRRMPLRTAAELKQASEVIRQNKRHFPYAQSRWIEIALNNSALRQAVENEIRSLSQRARKQFLSTLKHEPVKVLNLYGARQTRRAINSEYRTTRREMTELFVLMMNYLKVKAKKPGKDADTQDTSTLRTLEAAAKKLALEKQKIDGELSEERFITAVVIAVNQIIYEVTASTVREHPSSEGSPAIVPSRASNIEQCIDKAGQKRTACQAKCPAGRGWETCQAVCEATHVAEALICLLL